MQDENTQTDPANSARVVMLHELPEPSPAGAKLFDGNLSLIAGVKVKLEAVVGGAEITVGELFSLQEGSVVALDQLRDAPLVIRLDGRTVATGTLVVVGDHFGVRISAIHPVAAAKSA